MSNFSNQLLQFAMVLMIVQASPPVPGQASNTRTDSGHQIQKQGGNQQKPAITPSLIDSGGRKVSQDTGDQQGERENNKPIVFAKPITVSIVTTWWERLYVIFTGLLVIAAGAGAYFANLTLQTMQSQLRRMEEQTAGIAKSAEAAKASADGLKLSERAWMVAWEPEMVIPSGEQPREEVWFYNCSFKNTGRTPARIVEICIELGKTDSLNRIPQSPAYSTEKTRQYNTVLVAPNDSLRLPGAELFLAVIEAERVWNEKLFLYGYGFVKYLDVFSKNEKDVRETRFCHCLQVVDARKTEGWARPCLEAPKEYHSAT